MEPTPPLSVAVIGASTNRAKFGNRAVRAFAQRGYRVFPIHPSASTVEGIPAYRSIRDVPVEALDVVSVYVPPDVGQTILGDLACKPAREVWFNPGSESPALIARARELGLNVIVACSLIGLGAADDA
ncbi:MAG: CoA-binding protein [Gemmataceae bacterium]|nr:CoA-binding protein [Gemmataceae bacterium]MDW8264506.1 CoA-binding protein [Gemmataceae bacterium]